MIDCTLIIIFRPPESINNSIEIVIIEDLNFGEEVSKGMLIELIKFFDIDWPGMEIDFYLSQMIQKFNHFMIRNIIAPIKDFYSFAKSHQKLFIDIFLTCCQAFQQGADLTGIEVLYLGEKDFYGGFPNESIVVLCSL